MKNGTRWYLWHEIPWKSNNDGVLALVNEYMGSRYLLAFYNMITINARNWFLFKSFSIFLRIKKKIFIYNLRKRKWQNKIPWTLYTLIYLSLTTRKLQNYFKYYGSANYQPQISVFNFLNFKMQRIIPFKTHYA